jgi:chain length determinant protein (polysaccharide antigen chain regulator)
MVRNHHRLVESEEIDLTKIYKGLWAQKIIILLCTIIVFLAAAAYAWRATPLYEANFLVQPPTQNDISNFNYGRGGDSNLPLLTVKDVYDVYLKHLRSESLRLELFRTVYQPTLTEEQRKARGNALFNWFSRSIEVSLTSKDDPTRFTITATEPSPDSAVQWVAAFAQLAGEKAKEEVLSSVKSDATVKANNLEREIDRLQASARKDRDDRIVRLNESLAVAKSIGLEKPPIIDGKLTNEVSSTMDGSMDYMRGSKAIEAEINNLQKRQSDDPFIWLRGKQESLSFYRTLFIDPATVTVFRQDGVVATPDQPVKPRKMLILALGLVLGFALGIALAFIRFLMLEKGSPQHPPQGV